MTLTGTGPAGSPLVEVRGLTSGHRLGRPDEVVAPAGLDLDVMPGEFVALLGTGVSGKTTLLRVLAGLEAPAAGQAVVGGVDLARATTMGRDRYRRHLVGFVAEQPESGLWPSLTAIENVQAPMLIAGVAARERRRRSIELLESLGLGAWLWQQPAWLPGGERLRLALAVALANRPVLLLVDEPLGQLDAQTAHATLVDLGTLLRSQGTALLAASRRQEVAQYVDRIAWMSASTAPLPDPEAEPGWPTS